LYPRFGGFGVNVKKLHAFVGRAGVRVAGCPVGCVQVFRQCGVDLHLRLDHVIVLEAQSGNVVSDVGHGKRGGGLCAGAGQLQPFQLIRVRVILLVLPDNGWQVISSKRGPPRSCNIVRVKSEYGIHAEGSTVDLDELYQLPRLEFLYVIRKAHISPIKKATRRRLLIEYQDVADSNPQVSWLFSPSM